MTIEPQHTVPLAPTQLFNHANPDKLSLPRDTDKVPYKFLTGMGH